MDITFVALFLLASIGSSAVLVFALRAGAAKRAKLQQFARMHGWQYDYIPAKGSGSSETILTDPSEGWTLTIYFYSSNSGRTRSHTQYCDPGLAIPDGMAVLGPDIPAKTREMADKMIGMMGGDIGRFLLDKITNGLGEEAQGLRSIDSQGSGTLMASPGAETSLDGIRFAPELANARAGRNEAQQPIVMRGPFGLRLRIPKRLRKPDQIKAFIDLGRALSDNLRTS